MSKLLSRHFKLWAYTVSHNFLIIRSPMTYKDSDNYSESTSFNIDIEFTAVAYLDLPSSFSGIEIQEMKENIPEKFKDFKTNWGFKIFEIKSDKKMYYVVAASYRVGKNNWMNEDRIVNPSLEYDEILETSNI